MNEQDLRDVFAMFAMNGLLAQGFHNNLISRAAYKMADEMLEARKPQEAIGLPAIKRKAKSK